MKAASIRAKAAEAERDAPVTQKKAAKAKNIELEVSTTVEINKLNTNLSVANKEVKKLKKEKKKLEKEL